MSLSKLQEIVKDRRAWYATVHGVTKNWTWLSNWTRFFQGNSYMQIEIRLWTKGIYALWASLWFLFFIPKLDKPDTIIFVERKKVKSLSRVRLFATPWPVAYQAPPSMGFSRQEYWSALPFPSPGDIPNPGIEPGSPALEADSLTSESPGTRNIYRSRTQFSPFGHQNKWIQCLPPTYFFFLWFFKKFYFCWFKE